MTVDLCTVNYNTKKELDRHIKALISDVDFPEENYMGTGFLRHDRPILPWSLHIADNGSTEDNSRMYLERAMVPENVCLNQNIGYARACNQLATLGDGDIIGLLNSDVWMTTAQVQQVQRTFDEHPEVDILGPKQRDETGAVVHGGIFGTNTAPKFRGWKQSDIYDELYRDLLPAVTVSGSAYFVRRTVWEALTNDEEYQAVIRQLMTEGLIRPDALRYPGAFLPTMHYYEETFCSYFARHRGYGVFYDGRVSIGHSWHASHEVGSPQDMLFHESQATFRRACDMLGIERD